MNHSKLLKAAILSVMAFGLSSFPHDPNSGSRRIASCEGENQAIAPAIPFGANLYAQVNAAAFKESQSYWLNYLNQVETDARASRMAIRNSYGLDLPQQPSVASAAGLAPTSFAANSAAFIGFTPLSTFNTTSALNLPSFNRVGGVTFGSTASLGGSGPMFHL